MVKTDFHKDNAIIDIFASIWGKLSDIFTGL